MLQRTPRHQTGGQADPPPLISLSPLKYHPFLGALLSPATVAMLKQQHVWPLEPLSSLAPRMAATLTITFAQSSQVKALTDPKLGSEMPWMCQPSQMTWQCSSYRGADKCRASPAILAEDSPRKELPMMPSSSPKVGRAGATDTSLFHRQHTGTRKTPALFQCSLHIMAPQTPLRAEPK